MDEKLDKILTLLGEERETTGTLAVRLEEHIMDENRRCDIIAETQQDVLRALNGSNKGPGAFERIRVLEKFSESVKTWGMWLKVGVAGLIVKLVWEVVITAKGMG